MKLILKCITIFFLSLYSVSFVFASESTTQNSSSDGSIKVTVTEKIPGANCVEDTSWWTGTSKLYKCTIQPWFKTVQLMIGQIIKWFTAIAALSWVLFIVVNGILLSMHGGDKDKVKGRIKQTISGLILLLLSGVILSIIAPWVYK